MRKRSGLRMYVSCFQTDLQIIFGMLKYKSNKKDLTNYVQANKNYFGDLDEDSYNAAKALLGSERYLKLERKTNGGIDMCKALEDLYQDGVNEGMMKKQRHISRGLSGNR